MANRVKLAFVGTGDVFLKYYLPEAMEQDVIEISAICDNAPGRAEEVAAFVGGAEDYDDMLERSSAEVVVILTPPMSHYPWRWPVWMQGSTSTSRSPSVATWRRQTGWSEQRVVRLCT